jgi:DNA-binding NarL/FixJ family response regulator
VGTLMGRFVTQRATVPLPDRRAKSCRAKALESRQLTRREHEVLELICESGPTYQQIANTLGISWETVRQYVAAIYRKTGYGTMPELIANTLHKRYQENKCSPN